MSVEGVLESYLLLTLGAPVVGLLMIGVATIVQVGIWVRRRFGLGVYATPPHGMFFIGAMLIVIPSVLFALGFGGLLAWFEIQELL